MLSSNLELNITTTPSMSKYQSILVGCVVSELLSIKETRSVGIAIFYNMD